MPVTYATPACAGPRPLGRSACGSIMRGYNHVAGINICGDCLPYDA